jgi:hypothetical protein
MSDLTVTHNKHYQVLDFKQNDEEIHLILK